MAQVIVPAIIREFTTGDRQVTVINTPYDGVYFRRGWGDTGYRVETVECDCPECGFDRMIRRHDVDYERPDMVRYWCLNPNCLYYVRDYLSHECNGSYPQRQAQQPAVSDKEQT